MEGNIVVEEDIQDENTVNRSHTEMLTCEKGQLLGRETAKKWTINRTAMGEYIPQDNGKPLTQLAIPLPGAADYSPSISLTKPSPPQYSIVGKPKPPPFDPFPGPNKYKTEGDMVWRDRGFPLIGKSKSDRHETCSLGPAAYLLTHGNLSEKNSKCSMSGRQKIMHGPPDYRVQPVDSQGFKTPGPAKYRPKSSHWQKNIKKSFGLALPLQTNQLNSITPGPAVYDIRCKDRGPAYSLSKRLPTPKASDNPGPAAYDLGTTIGKAVAKSISSRQPEISNLWAPSPNTYGVPSRLGEGPKCSMTYRSFERNVSPQPGPDTYKCTIKNLKQQPVYSCRKVCRPIYPDILNYAEYSVMKNSVVGPGTYDHQNHFSKNDAPAHSMGKRFQQKSEETPGPATYNVKLPARPDGKRVAAFSMGIRIEARSGTVGPGPAAYYPKVKTSAPQYSMGKRYTKQKSSTAPAPNSYEIHSGQTNRGILKGPNPTLKARPSPFVYSGFRRILT